MKAEKKESRERNKEFNGTIVLTSDRCNTSKVLRARCTWNVGAPRSPMSSRRADACFVHLIRQRLSTCAQSGERNQEISLFTCVSVHRLIAGSTRYAPLKMHRQLAREHRSADVSRVFVLPLAHADDQQVNNAYHPWKAIMPPSNQQTSRSRSRRIVQGTLQHDRAYPMSPIVSSCVVSIPPLWFDNVFGLRKLHDTASIFYRPIHNEVVLPFECVTSAPRT